MNRDQKIAKLIEVEHAFEPAVERLIAVFKDQFIQHTLEGLTPDREEALVEFKKQLDARKEALQEAQAKVYGEFTDEQLDALLIVAQLEATWVAKMVAINNNWMESAKNAS